MRRQRNTAQMKEQIKTPEKELNKMEMSNLSDAEFKTLAIRMLKELSEDLNSIKKIQSLIEIKNNSQGNNNRVNEAENQINNLEHNETKNNQSDQQEEKGIQNSKDSKGPLGQLQQCQHSHLGGARSERPRNYKLI